MSRYSSQGHSPVGAGHVALAHGADLAVHVGGDSVLGLELVTEGAVTVVDTFVVHDANEGLLSQLRGGDGNGGQTGEDDLEAQRISDRNINIFPARSASQLLQTSRQVGATPFLGYNILPGLPHPPTPSTYTMTSATSVTTPKNPNASRIMGLLSKGFIALTAAPHVQESQRPPLKATMKKLLTNFMAAEEEVPCVCAG